MLICFISFYLFMDRVIIEKPFTLFLQFRAAAANACRSGHRRMDVDRDEMIG